MKKSTLLVVVLIIAALGVGGLFVLARQNDDSDSNGAESTTNQQQAEQQDTTTQNPDTSTDNSAEPEAGQVEIKDFAFGPSTITIKKGTAVTWTNKDDVQHSVVPDDGDSDAFQGSELLAKDESYSFTFGTPGTYAYHCGPHPNMTATVTVTE
jgi:plastocyanin